VIYSRFDERLLPDNIVCHGAMSNIHGDAQDESEILSVDNIFKMIKFLEDLD